MHGNALEWCEDWYGSYLAAPQIDPSGPASGSSRVMRGGGWNNYLKAARSAARGYHMPDTRGGDGGFRLVRELCLSLSGVSIGATGSTTLCSGTTGGTGTVTDTGGGTSTHQWGYRTSNGGSITTLTGRIGITYLVTAVDFGGAGTFYVVCTTTPTCGSPTTSNELTVIVNALPVAAITAGGPTTFCAGGSVTLTSSAGSSYVWSTGATTSSITVSTSGSYWVKETDGNGCQSVQSDATVVTVNPTPGAPSASSNSPVCEGGTLQLSVGVIAGAAYSWSGPNGFASSQQLPTIAPATLLAAGTYNVTATVNGCPSPAGSTTIAVNAKPSTPSITAPTSVPANGTELSASITGHSGSTYAWGITNGTITSGGSAAQVTFTAGATGPVVLTVVETSGAGCASSQASLSIPVIATSTQMYPTTPCRLFDTRNSSGPDEADPVLAVGETRVFTIGGRCSLPTSAKALSVNQTVTGQTANGELLLYRGDITLAPTASSLSFAVGKTRANNGILELARDGSGTFKVWNNSAGTVHFVLDVNGYFQ